jgi:uncharacterized protein (TIGR02246 family)
MPAIRPEDCDRLFAKHTNAGDLEALLSLDEPVCSMVQRDGTVAVGRDAIRAAFVRLLAAAPKVDVAVTKVVAAGDDLAMLYSDWTMSLAGRNGGRVDSEGQAIEIVRRQPEGTWRFVLDDPFARTPRVERSGRSG